MWFSGTTERRSGKKTFHRNTTPIYAAEPAFHRRKKFPGEKQAWCSIHEEKAATSLERALGKKRKVSVSQMRNGIPRIGLTYSVDQTSGYHLYGTIRPLINRYNKDSGRGSFLIPTESNFLNRSRPKTALARNSAALRKKLQDTGLQTRPNTRNGRVRSHTATDTPAAADSSSSSHNDTSALFEKKAGTLAHSQSSTTLRELKNTRRGKYLSYAEAERIRRRRENISAVLSLPLRPMPADQKDALAQQTQTLDDLKSSSIDTIPDDGSSKRSNKKHHRKDKSSKRSSMKTDSHSTLSSTDSDQKNDDGKSAADSEEDRFNLTNKGNMTLLGLDCDSSEDEELQELMRERRLQRLKSIKEKDAAEKAEQAAQREQMLSTQKSSKGRKARRKARKARR